MLNVELNAVLARWAGAVEMQEDSRGGAAEFRMLGVRPYTFTAKRYTFTYARVRIEPDHEKPDFFAKTRSGTGTGTMGARTNRREPSTLRDLVPWWFNYPL